MYYIGWKSNNQIGTQNQRKRMTLQDFNNNKEEKAVAEAETPRVESVMTVDKHVKGARNGKKVLVAVVCGIFLIALAIGGYFLWKNYNGKYERQLVDGKPVYSTELVKYAENGDSVAQCDLGTCYIYGRGVERDYSEAVRWYRKAAEQGYARGQCSLGLCYYNGTGVEQDYSEAVHWYRKAAEQGFAGGQACLGECYFYGRGVEQDY